MGWCGEGCHRKGSNPEPKGKVKPDPPAKPPVIENNDTLEKRLKYAKMYGASGATLDKIRKEYDDMALAIVAEYTRMGLSREQFKKIVDLGSKRSMLFLLTKTYHNGRIWTKTNVGYVYSFEEATAWTRLDDEHNRYEEIQEYGS